MNEEGSMNKRTGLIIIGIFLFIVPISFSLSGHPFPFEIDEREMNRRHMEIISNLVDCGLYDGRIILSVKDKIGLTADQEEKIENLMLDYEAFSIRNSGEIKIKELRFASYLRSGEMDRNEVAKHIREISKEKTDMIVRHLNHVLDLKEILTPDQRRKMAELRDKWRESRQKHRGENKPL
jgi:Spy/CpxP family protein refolding chaperone